MTIKAFVSIVAFGHGPANVASDGRMGEERSAWFLRF